MMGGTKWLVSAALMVACLAVPAWGQSARQESLQRTQRDELRTNAARVAGDRMSERDWHASRRYWAPVPRDYPPVVDVRPREHHAVQVRYASAPVVYAAPVYYYSDYPWYPATSARIIYSAGPSYFHYGSGYYGTYGAGWYTPLYCGPHYRHYYPAYPRTSFGLSVRIVR